jgi:hypothetical protein
MDVVLDCIVVLLPFSSLTLATVTFIKRYALVYRSQCARDSRALTLSYQLMSRWLFRGPCTWRVVTKVWCVPNTHTDVPSTLSRSLAAGRSRARASILAQRALLFSFSVHISPYVLKQRVKGIIDDSTTRTRTTIAAVTPQDRRPLPRFSPPCIS